jgi:hypothetical protein
MYSPWVGHCGLPPPDVRGVGSHDLRKNWFGTNREIVDGDAGVGGPGGDDGVRGDDDGSKVDRVDD